MKLLITLKIYLKCIYNIKVHCINILIYFYRNKVEISDFTVLSFCLHSCSCTTDLMMCQSILLYNAYTFFKYIFNVISGDLLLHNT